MRKTSGHYTALSGQKSRYFTTMRCRNFSTFCNVSTLIKRVAFPLVLLVLAGNLHAQLGYTEKGRASYYADKFHGRMTASGEPHNKNAFTCAHPKLNFGTLLRVTNLDNGKHVVVRVNDRGPFSPGRIVDLSKAAAFKIDMLQAGVVPVRIEVVGIDGKLRDEEAAPETANPAPRPVAQPEPVTPAPETAEPTEVATHQEESPTPSNAVVSTIAGNRYNREETPEAASEPTAPPNSAENSPPANDSPDEETTPETNPEPPLRFPPPETSAGENPTTQETPRRSRLQSGNDEPENNTAATREEPAPTENNPEATPAEEPSTQSAPRGLRAFEPGYTFWHDGNYHPTDGQYTLQCGAFSSLENAREQVGNLQRAGFEKLYIRVTENEGQRLYRVLLGEYPRRNIVERRLQEVEDKGFDAYITRHQ